MTERDLDMAVAAKPASESRWRRAFQGRDRFADDLGSLGAWVGPPTGPDKRSHGEKDDYVLRRLLVAWRQAGRLRFPFQVSAPTDDKTEPDFVLAWPDGDTLGVEVTEAGEEDYQAWLTRVEWRREGAPGAESAPFEASTPRTAAAIRKSIGAKVRKFDNGWYRAPSACDLVVYDNTTWGGILDEDAVLAAIDRRGELVGRFRQIGLVTGPFVFLDLFGNEFRKVDVRNTYEIDYVNWIGDQVARMRRGATDELDLLHVAEELEDLARSDRRRLGSHLRNLLRHLLKWAFQPARRGKSWQRSITVARTEIEDLLSDSPSLGAHLLERLPKEYRRARKLAHFDTGFEIEIFPESCPYDVKQLLDADFLPNGGD